MRLNGSVLAREKICGGDVRLRKKEKNDYHREFLIFLNRNKNRETKNPFIHVTFGTRLFEILQFSQHLITLVFLKI